MKKILFKANATKRKPISVRLLESDLAKLKSAAVREGLGYQTLISSIIHKYLNGNLISSK